MFIRLNITVSKGGKCQGTLYFFPLLPAENKYIDKLITYCYQQYHLLRALSMTDTRLMLHL